MRNSEITQRRLAELLERYPLEKVAKASEEYQYGVMH